MLLLWTSELLAQFPGEQSALLTLQSTSLTQAWWALPSCPAFSWSFYSPLGQSWEVRGLQPRKMIWGGDMGWHSLLGGCVFPDVGKPWGTSGMGMKHLFILLHTSFHTRAYPPLHWSNQDTAPGGKT